VLQRGLPCRSQPTEGVSRTRRVLGSRGSDPSFQRRTQAHTAGVHFFGGAVVNDAPAILVHPHGSVMAALCPPGTAGSKSARSGGHRVRGKAERRRPPVNPSLLEDSGGVAKGPVR
jgi:hypothetical protein